MRQSPSGCWTDGTSSPHWRAWRLWVADATGRTDAPRPGTTLARVHAADASELPRLSMAERLHHWFHHPTVECPSSFLRAIERMIVALIPLYQESQFVHGDWGDANVLAPRGDPDRIVKIIDFEGAHLGDSAEDFKWTLAHGALGSGKTTLGRCWRSHFGPRS